MMHSTTATCCSLWNVKRPDKEVNRAAKDRALFPLRSCETLEAGEQIMNELLSFATSLAFPRTVIILKPAGREMYMEVRREGVPVGRVLVRGRD